jgi:hypothetical protein
MRRTGVLSQTFTFPGVGAQPFPAGGVLPV